MKVTPPTPQKDSAPKSKSRVKPWAWLMAFTLACGGLGIVTYTRDQAARPPAQPAAAVTLPAPAADPARDAQLKQAKATLDAENASINRMHQFNLNSCSSDPGGGVFEHFAIDPATGKTANSLVPAHYGSQAACVVAADKEYNGAQAQASAQYTAVVTQITGTAPAAKLAAPK